MAKIMTLKDSSGNQVLPVTSTEAVKDAEGNTLQDKLTELENNSVGNTITRNW